MLSRTKEIYRTATCAWYPRDTDELLVTGTLAGCLDTPELEIVSMDSTISSRIPTQHRFHVLTWGHPSKESPYGIIAGGTDTGELELYDAVCLLNGYSLDHALQFRNAAHTGILKALDFNPFQTNLLASAGSHNEIFIWDLNHPVTPSAPGNRSSRMDDIVSIAWNGQVQHIIASASTNGYTVVWDLRNKKEIMTLAGSLSSLSSIAWHPQVATQIVTASDDDQSPYLTLWDLRHAHSPERQLKGHSKGILDLSWSKTTSRLLSCGKDEKTLCWNPTTGELLNEFQSKGPLFQVAWSPQPNLFSAASFDGLIQVLEMSHRKPSKPQQRCPISASFGWHGQLVRCHAGQSKVILSSIKPDPISIAQSDQFEAALSSNTLGSLLEMRLQQTPEDDDWPLIQLMLSKQPRQDLVHYLKSHLSSASLECQDSSLDSLEKETWILQALVTGQLEAAVDACLTTHRFADALMIASYGGRELMARTQKAYLDQRVQQSKTMRFFSHLVHQDWTFEPDELVDWAQLLMAICTYVPSHQLATVCERLGDQLVGSRQSLLAYMIAGNLAQVISIWLHTLPSLGWQSFVEKVTVLKEALEDDTTRLDGIYHAYAIWLMDQGRLDLAEKYFNQCRTLLK
ncbi:Protein transport protein sec31 [Choanephora cucurbitarum]|uniref:Protein transport protein SEC31 n=1 Tax=Choanephora cucurbitarum TaxID=101091 RepID=A0A1C7N182_9FUNG|nr:Protein transport protein sec31 [Choanephora cucurbitarum]